MVRKIKFKKFANEFQNRMRQDIQQIKRSDKVYVPADKTTNMYKVRKDKYERLLTNSITADYKKEETDLSNEINYSGKKSSKIITP